MQRLRSALPYVELANTDDDLLNESAEIILMASAFEQVFRADASAYKLTKKFGVLFNACGSVTVSAVTPVRPGIKLDEDPTYAAEQPNWWIHRKWVEELYDLRSKLVHRGVPTSRPWGWSPAEHLVMAAFVFPVVVKGLLEREGHYVRSEDDDVRCESIDKLLAVTEWHRDSDDGRTTRWDGTVSRVRRDRMFARAFASALRDASIAETE